MKHTPEPWYVTDCIDPRLVLYHPTLNGSPNPLTETIVSAYCDIGGKARANLKRAAECVNALSGLNPAGVKGMVEAATAVIDRWDSPDWKIQAPTADVMNALRTALANLKGNAAQAVIDAGGKGKQ